MLIRCDPTPLLLPPVPRLEWREPSLALPKDYFGRQNRTRFVIRGWRVDGGLVEERWYEDRDEFDYDLWQHIVEEPYEDIFWEWATTTTLTSPTGSNQTYNVPSDWNSSNNTIWTIGGGAGGGAALGGGFRCGIGGGGGGCGIYANLSLTPSGTATYRIAATAAGGSVSASGTANGTAGNDSWFNGATYAAASVGGLGGGAGLGVTANTTGPAGGGGKGTSNFTGGSGGTKSGGGFAKQGTGGGGAAGGSGNGGNGVEESGTTSPHATNGGAGDNGSGGSAGSGTTTSPGGDGGNASNMDGGIGAGGGGGGCAGSGSTTRVGGNGGNYGGGAGGAAVGSASGPATGGTGQQGAIIVTYTPAVSGVVQAVGFDREGRRVRMVPYNARAA